MALIELLTARLHLRKLIPDDAAAISSLRSDETVNKFINRSREQGLQVATAFITQINQTIDENRLFYWAITLKDSPKPIGTICLWNISEDWTTAEVGFEIIPAFQGKGIMQEALEAVLQYAFSTCRFVKLKAIVHPENLRSIKLLSRNGFMRNGEIQPGGAENCLVFTRTSPTKTD